MVNLLLLVLVLALFLTAGIYSLTQRSWAIAFIAFGLAAWVCMDTLT